MTPLPFSDLLTQAELRHCRATSNGNVSMSPHDFLVDRDFVASTAGFFVAEGHAEIRAHLIARFLNAAPLIDRLVKACENLEPDNENANIHEAITIAPELRAILDGKQ